MSRHQSSRHRALFLDQSEKRPESGRFTCRQTGICIRPSFPSFASPIFFVGGRGRGPDRRLAECRNLNLTNPSSMASTLPKKSTWWHCSLLHSNILFQCPLMEVSLIPACRDQWSSPVENLGMTMQRQVILHTNHKITTVLMVLLLSPEHLWQYCKSTSNHGCHRWSMYDNTLMLFTIIVIFTVGFTSSWRIVYIEQ